VYVAFDQLLVGGRQIKVNINASVHGGVNEHAERALQLIRHFQQSFSFYLYFCYVKIILLNFYLTTLEHFAFSLLGLNFDNNHSAFLLLLLLLLLLNKYVSDKQE